MRFLLLICFSMVLIACNSSNSSSSFDMVDVIQEGRDNFSEMEKSLINQEIATTFYLMYVRESSAPSIFNFDRVEPTSIARLIHLENRKEGTYFLDVKCDVSGNNIESFNQFDAPEKIKVTGIVKAEDIEVSNSLILRGLTSKSLNYILEKEKLDEINVAGVLSFNMKSCEAFK